MPAVRVVPPGDAGSLVAPMAEPAASVAMSTPVVSEAASSADGVSTFADFGAAFGAALAEVTGARVRKGVVLPSSH